MTILEHITWTPHIFLTQENAKITYGLTSFFFSYDNFWVNVWQTKLKGHLPFPKPGIMRTGDWVHIPRGDIV